MTTPEEKKAQNRARQAAYRKRQLEQNERKMRGVLMNEDEAFYVYRVLLTMRKTGATPCMARASNGRYVPIDV